MTLSLAAGPHEVLMSIEKILIPIRELSKLTGGDYHCCLHIALDDGNMEDFSLGFCYGYASAKKHELCSFIASWMHALSEDERFALYEMGSLRDEDIPEQYRRDTNPWHCEMPSNLEEPKK